METLTETKLSLQIVNSLLRNWSRKDHTPKKHSQNMGGLEGRLTTWRYPSQEKLYLQDFKTQEEALGLPNLAINALSEDTDGYELMNIL